MTLSNIFCRPPPPPPPEPIPVVIATNVDLGLWCYRAQAHPTRFVQKIEMCTALCAGDDALIDPLELDDRHYHTLLRISLGTRSDPDTPEDTLLIERVIDIWGAYHSVTPLSKTFLTTGTASHPWPHDRICVISEGPSTVLADDLQVERTLELADRSLTLAQFACVLAFVSKASENIRDGDKCQFHSRSFAFRCLAAFTPTLPPQEANDLEGVDARMRNGENMVDDSEFEIRAEAVLRHVPGIVDPASMQALKLIAAFRKTTLGDV